MFYYEQFLHNQTLFAILIVWSLIWKGLALWRAANLKHKIWFIILLVLNTLGIAEIIYLLATQKKIKKKETPTV